MNKQPVLATIVGDGQRYAIPDGDNDAAWMIHEKGNAGTLYHGDRVWVIPPGEGGTGYHYCEAIKKVK